MLKTLLITTDFPPNIGGVSEYLSQICARLPSSSISVLAQPEENSEKFDYSQHYRVYRDNFYFSNRFVWPKWLVLLKKSRKLIREKGINQILVGQILPVGTVALMFNLLFSVPYIVSTHAMDITILSNSGRKTRLAKLILKHSKAVITVSEFTKSRLVELGIPNEKINIISPGTDLLEHNTIDNQEKMKNKYNLNGKRVLLTVGRIIERKGHMEVLKALPSVLKVFPDTHYVIISDGPYKSELEKYVSINSLKSNVTFTGTISRDDLPSFYRLSEIFIMPTSMLDNNDVEGFGIVYLEANAFGKPVIGYDTGGVSDAVVNNETGILVEPKNPEEIAVSIISLLKDKDYAQKLGEQGRTRVENEFTWEVRAEKLKELL
jgi:phosphatidyl-myo-inositol dimannoside synthase